MIINNNKKVVSATKHKQLLIIILLSVSALTWGPHLINNVYNNIFMCMITTNNNYS